MPVEFLGIGATNDGSETTPRSGPASTATTRCASPAPTRSTAGTGCSPPTASGSPDPAQAAAYIADHTDDLQLLLAHRPNLSIPTFAAKTVRDARPDQRRPAHASTSSPAATTTSSAARATS